MRLLDRERVAYATHRYDPGIKTAREVAAVLHVQPDQVYKTLVLLADQQRRLLVMVPGDHEVDLKYLAVQIGAKSARMAPRAEAERMTGLLTGGIGALALVGHPFEVYLDRRALERDQILVNGGRRGLNLALAPADLVRLTGATPVETFRAAPHGSGAAGP